MSKRFNLFDKFGNEIGTATESSGGGEAILVFLVLIVTFGVFYLAYKLIIAIYESFNRMDKKVQQRVITGGVLMFIAASIIFGLWEASVESNGLQHGGQIVLAIIVTIGAFCLIFLLAKASGQPNKTKERILACIAISILAALLVFVSLMSLRMIPTSNVTGSSTCGQALEPLLTIGQKAIVTHDGDSLALRTGDGLNQSRITVLGEGTVVMVIGGPRCTDGYNWWQLQTRYGTGWSVESNGQSYWLEQRGR